MIDFRFDLRLALRSLRRAPAFTATALATLALGIGLTTAVFSFVHSLLLRPLPFREPGRLVQVHEAFPARSIDGNPVNPGNFLHWRENAKSFSALSAYIGWRANIAGDGAAERLPIGYVSPDFFDTLGVRALLGRTFVAEDGVAGKDDVVVLAASLWRQRYGADPAILGRRILVDGQPTTVVGVAAETADVPASTALWEPIAFTERHRASRGRFYSVIGRLAPGATLGSARAEMKTLAARLEQERPEVDTGWTVTLAPLADELAGGYRRAVLLLLGAAGAVLLIACANLSGLLMARQFERRHELAVRGALGAGRGRIARQLLAESLVVAAIGGALGLTVAGAALPLLRALVARDLPLFLAPAIDGRVLGFTVGVTLLCGFLFGTAPAWRATRAELREAISDHDARAGSRLGWRSSLLVVGQVALSLAVVASAGLLARSLDRLRSTDPGFRSSGLLAARIDLAGPAYAKPESLTGFYDRLEARLASRGNVEAVGGISWLPLAGNGAATSYHAADRPEPAAGEAPVADVRVVTPGFFRTAGISLLAGRLLEPGDQATAARVVVVNQVAARELWGDRDPIGRELVANYYDSAPARVVGVVADVRLSAIEEKARGTVYWSHAQLPSNFMALLVRPRGDAAPVVAVIREAVAAIDPQVPVSQVSTMEEVIAAGIRRPRITSSLLGLFALLGLALSAIGLYGLLSGAVAERRRELGIRLALGADSRRLLTGVLARGLRLVALGVAVGTPLALAVGKLVASQLYETSPLDPLALSAAPLLLLAVGAAACALPARRAARTDPATVLREG
jgi:predicted permease